MNFNGFQNPYFPANQYMGQTFGMANQQPQQMDYIHERNMENAAEVKAAQALYKEV